MKKNHSTSLSTYSNGDKMDMVDKTIIVTIIRNKIELTHEEKTWLSVLIDNEYEGCCGCDETDDIYITFMKMIDYTGLDPFYEANCGNGHCFHIRKLSKLINIFIQNKYPFRFETISDITPDMYEEMKKYIKLTPEDKILFHDYMKNNIICSRSVLDKLFDKEMNERDELKIIKCVESHYVGSFLRPYLPIYISTNSIEIDEFCENQYSTLPESIQKEVSPLFIRNMIYEFLDSHR